MKESYGKGSASRPDPESCTRVGNGTSEALTGADAGRPSSCEIRSSGVPTPLCEAEGHTAGGDIGEPSADPAQSKTPRMRRNSLHGNREVPSAPVVDGAAGRSGKVETPKPDMHADGKSDVRMVPKKPPNNGGTPTPAEAVEGRRATEGNTRRADAFRTQSRTDADGLHRVRTAARKDKRARFTALLHHVTVDRLRSGFLALKRNASPGVDGLTWRQYEVELEERLTELHERVRKGSYRALPAKRAYIPKPDGQRRPLGIAALEDKIVQQAVAAVLGSVFEQDFLGFSYGFRPGRATHDALDALWVGLMGKKVNWVLDVDIQDFFGTMNHEWTLKFVEHRIADPRMLRLVALWLRAGVSEDGKWSEVQVGCAQGAVISPPLANVYLHYVFDLWVQQWRTKTAVGDVIVVRYADDIAMGFQHRREAERFLRELRERLGKFGLAVHPEKTRLIEFGRFAAENRVNRGERKPETFDFLGFTHICARKLLSRGFIVKRKSAKKRLRAKLRTVKDALLKRRHLPVPEQGAWLRGVVQGWFNYHAVPGNMSALETFRLQAVRSWLTALRRRSQRSRLNWDRFGRIADHWIPKPEILHPHPNERFYAKHPK